MLHVRSNSLGTSLHPLGAWMKEEIRFLIYTYKIEVSNVSASCVVQADSHNVRVYLLLA